MERDTTYNLGNKMMREGRYGDAINLYSRALKIDPSFDYAYYNRGLCRFYSDDNGGLDDLIQAASLGCEFDPLYEALCRYSVSIHGFEATAKLITKSNLPDYAKEHLSREMRTKLYNAHYLLVSRKLQNNQLDEGALIGYCQIADAATAEGIKQTPAEQCSLLRRALADAQRANDKELEWRAWYLLGVMAYFPIAVSGFPPHLPLDVPEIFLPLAWSDKETSNLLLELTEENGVQLPDNNENVRMASIAHNFFHRASSLLCALSVEPRFLESGDFEHTWYLCEDVFRELARCCVFLDSTHGLIDAIESARFCYHMYRAHSLGADSKRSREKIRENYGSVSYDQILNVLGNDGLLLDYYIGEIVEDRMLVAAAMQASGTVAEAEITVISPGDKKAGRSLLSALLEANEHWMPGSTRYSYLNKALEGFDQKGHKEPLIAMLARFDFTDFPESIEPRLDNLLLESVKDKLNNCRRLAIVPFNYLNNFPFHALPTIQAAIQQGSLQSIVYTPSVKLQTNNQGRKNSTNKESRHSCLFVGYDAANKLAIDRELEVINNTFAKVKVLVGEEATTANVLSMMPEFDALHFCCHGSFDVDSESTYLALAGGKLFAIDVLRAESVPSLVFANSCISATGSRSSRNGDQVMGLHTAFLLSGAKGVIGTLWKVHDDVAVDLAADFYQGWTRDIDTPAAEIFTSSQRVIRERYPKLGMWAPHAFFGTMNM